MEEQELVEIKRPVRVSAAWAWPVLAGVLVLALVVFVALLAQVHGGPDDRVIVIPMRGDMQAVVVALKAPTEISAATLVLADGSTVECSTPLPGRVGALIFFADAAERPEQVEIVASGRQVVVQVGR